MAFREKDRLAQDWHTLRIHELEDFALFSERGKHRFSNMIYSYPLRDDQKAFIQNDLARASELSIRDGFNVDFNKSNLSLVKYFMMVAKKVPKVYREIIRDLDRVHRLAFPSRTYIDIELRYNSDYPQMKDYPHHIHPSVFTLTVEGDSIVLLNKNRTL